MRNLLAAALIALSAAAQTPAPPQVDLADALHRARAYSQQFLQAATAASLAREDRVQARSALLPVLTSMNQYIYTQGNGTPSGVFVSNDGVHVYNEQAVVHADLLSITRQAEFRRAQAAEAAARARQDIAARGLAAVVVQAYYGVVTAQRRLANAARSADEAQAFLDLSEKQEQGGEVAHADVVKAGLQVEQRRREWQDAEAAASRARLGLGVMLFPDVAQAFSVVDDLADDFPLPPRDQVSADALAGNPEVRAAEAGLRQAGYAVKSARGAYYPSLAVDYFYGINANVFGIRGPDRRENLGSVVQGTVQVPVWNWGATHSRVKQAQLQEKQAGFDLDYARRQVQADAEGLFLEAETARRQLASLKRSLDLASESLRLTILRYQGGEATALEVADAQTTLAQARNALDDGLARYRLAQAAIQILTGRL